MIKLDEPVIFKVSLKTSLFDIGHTANARQTRWSYFVTRQVSLVSFHSNYSRGGKSGE